ncbi:MAG: XRE family transcriptional regulator [Bacteroidetes bacterium]|nr:MAG: XRE family transcriptional regulator [Bacteroidota bacterium]
MDELNARVVQVMDESGLSKTEFAAKLEVSLSQLSHISSGRNKAGIELIQRMAVAFPKYSALWILTGQGSKYQKQGMDEHTRLWLQTTEQRLRELQLDLKTLELDIKQKRNEEEL